MCGIFGVVSFREKVDINLIINSTEILKHRGPDDSGIYLNSKGNVGFGHRRLSIIDLTSNGKQPMCNEDKSIWIVYNGEIYNFLTLKEELIKKGHIFKSNSDTEVIIHGYEEWKEQVLSKLRGMFSFVIYDENRDLIFCAIDRFGIKPFFYYIDNEKFLFSSELKAIYSYPGINKKINEIAIYDFFTYNYIPEPSTILANAFKLTAGHFLKLENKKINLVKYWDLDFTKKIKINEKDAISLISEKILDTIKVHRISDVPVGIFLSGGLDSSAILYFLKNRLSFNLLAFSIGFENPFYDETKYAKIISNVLNVNLTIKEMDYNLIKFLIPKVLDNFDECFADTSAIPTYYVSKIASESLKVCFSGEGGDECFGGYEWYSKFIDNYKRFSSKSSKNSLNIFSIINYFYPYIRYKLFFLEKNIFSEIEYYSFLIKITIKAKYKLIFINNFLKNFKYYDDYAYFKKYYNENLEVFDRLLYLDIKTYLQNDLLPKIDISGMANSLETRVPFVDHELFELSASLPCEIRNKSNIKKYLLKKILYGNLPNEIINKKKWGFAIPLERNFNISLLPKNLHPYLNDIINIKSTYRYYNPRHIWMILSLNNSINKLYPYD